MALKQNFCEEIYEEERNWCELIDGGLLNVYYLPVLRQFYNAIQLRLNYEYELTLNPLIRTISKLLNNVIAKIDRMIQEDQNGISINIKDLKKYFLINQLSSITNSIKSPILDNNELYSLRKKNDSSDVEDYIDDDFYYEKPKVA